MTTAMIKKSARFAEKTRAIIILSGIAMTILIATSYVFTPPYLNLLELKLYDAIFQQTYEKSEPTSVSIVDIDDNSLEAFGQWPWPRYRVALLLQKIHLAGARVVGIDILFAEPDGTSPSVLKKALERDLHIDVPFSCLPRQLMDNDLVLSNVLQMNNNVLGFSAKYHGVTNKALALPDTQEIEIREKGAGPASEYLPEINAFIPPLRVLTDKVERVGFMNALLDADGVMRKVPLFITCQGKIYPQLALAALMASVAPEGITPAIKVTRWGIESIKIGRQAIPVDKNGHMMINYRGPGFTFPYISAKDILEDKIQPATFKDKIVILGTSAEGLKDIRTSPLDQFFPGVEVHATIVDNILNQDYIHRPDYIPGLEFSMILIWGGIATCLIGFATPLFTLPVSLGLGSIAWYGSVWAIEHKGIWISPFFPILLLILVFSVLNMQKFWLAEKRKKFFKGAFSKYVSKAVVNQLADNPDQLSLTGEEKKLSILFSDIRSFTTISEQLTPSQVTELLHDYFTPVTEIIIEHGGTHDKFIGDAVMCFWNAPLDVANHEGLSIKAALKMIEALDTLNQKFEAKFGIKIAVGIGLHAGVCRVGNMGSDDIFDYTIIGDNVNLASRLEGLTKFYGVQLVVSDTMLKGVDDRMVVQELDQVRVKGKIEPVAIYTVYAADRQGCPIERELDLYHQGLNAYKKKDFSGAKDTFIQLVFNYPDKKVYSIYKERCEIFLKNPPGDEWDGVFTHVSK